MHNSKNNHLRNWWIPESLLHLSLRGAYKILFIYLFSFFIFTAGESEKECFVNCKERNSLNWTTSSCLKDELVNNQNMHSWVLYPPCSHLTLHKRQDTSSKIEREKLSPGTVAVVPSCSFCICPIMKAT
jgi:hypothetical protein